MEVLRGLPAVSDLLEPGESEGAAGKDEAGAGRLRTEGGQQFRAGDHRAALNTFTACLLISPPGRAYSLAAANRGLALSRLGRWRESLADTELALAAGYPAETR